MADVRLRKIRLTYFKGMQSYEVNFNEGETVISGNNETGKTTIFDAWSWLLFGKDSLGASDFQIKTIRPDGSVIEKADHEVYAELSVDGGKTTLRRVYREKWVKPRGQENEEMKGHETICYFDDVPVSVSEYQRRVSDMVGGETLFRLITNVYYFHTLKKEERRNILISMAGDLSNDSIVKDNPQFASLVEELGNRTIEDMKRKIRAEKSRIKGEIDQILIRIDETRKSMPEAPDTAEIEREIQERRDALAEIDRQLTDKQESVKLHIERMEREQRRKTALWEKQSKVLNDAREDELKRVREANRDYEEHITQIQDEEALIARLWRTLADLRIEIADSTAKQNELKDEKEKLASAWRIESERKYAQKEGCLICPLYNHECKDEDALFKFAQTNKDGEDEFLSQKQKIVSEILEKGTKLKGRIEAMGVEINDKISRGKKLEDEIKSHNERLSQMKEMKVSKVEPKNIEPEEIPEWVAIEEEIQSIVFDFIPQGTEELKERRVAIQGEIDSLNKSLAIDTQIKASEARIEELEKQQRSLSQELSGQEKIEYQILQFNKVKMEEVDRRVNGRFRYVTFKLFDKTLEDNEFETCETLINGVPYGSANNASKINAGLDIINAICEVNGVNAPIFIDNAESSNNVIKSDSQMVLLRVTTDQKLTIN